MVTPTTKNGDSNGRDSDKYSAHGRAARTGRGSRAGVGANTPAPVLDGRGDIRMLLASMWILRPIKAIHES